jgi:anaphase-promoting complex subunit 1
MTPQFLFLKAGVGSKAEHIVDVLDLYYSVPLTSSAPVELASLQREKHSHAVIKLMAQLKITKEDIAKLPLAISYPLHQILHALRPHPPHDWGLDEYTLISREDLAAQHANRVWEDIPRPPTAGVPESMLVSMRFPLDTRLKEVTKMLDSLAPRPVRTSQVHINVFSLSISSPLELGSISLISFFRCLTVFQIRVLTYLAIQTTLNDHELLEELQTKLLHVLQRTFALPVGRGMFALGSHTPILAEPIAVPAMALTGTRRKIPSPYVFFCCASYLKEAPG